MTSIPDENKRSLTSHAEQSSSGEWLCPDLNRSDLSLPEPFLKSRLILRLLQDPPVIGLKASGLSTLQTFLFEVDLERAMKSLGWDKFVLPGVSAIAVDVHRRWASEELRLQDLFTRGLEKLRLSHWKRASLDEDRQTGCRLELTGWTFDVQRHLESAIDEQALPERSEVLSDQWVKELSYIDCEDSAWIRRLREIGQSNVRPSQIKELARRDPHFLKFATDGILIARLSRRNDDSQDSRDGDSLADHQDEAE